MQFYARKRTKCRSKQIIKHTTFAYHLSTEAATGTGCHCSFLCCRFPEKITELKQFIGLVLKMNILYNKQGHRAHIEIRNKYTYRILFDEPNEGGAFDFDRLPIAVVQRNDKVEKVGFAQIAWRLLLEIGPTDAEAADEKEHNSDQLWNYMTYLEEFRKENIF